MPLCPNCGVELGSDAKTCPLCRAHVAGARPERPSGTYPQHVLDEGESLSPLERRTVVVEIFTICSLIAAFVVLGVNLLLERRISWAAYPVAALCFSWLAVCIPCILLNHPWLVFAVLGPSLLAFVLVLDALDGRLSWFLPLGLPIVLVVEAACVGCGSLIAAAKRKGANILAIVIAGVAFVCAGVEATLSLGLYGRFSLTWSAVVVICCVPVSGFFFYLHYRIVKQASLRKLFHL